jgi:hypothetical protein
MMKLPDNPLFNKPREIIVAVELNQRSGSQEQMMGDIWIWENH